MKLPIETEAGFTWKQLTWLAGRKATPQPWLQGVHISRHGAAASDGYVSGWCPSGVPALDTGRVLMPESTDLRSQIQKPGGSGFRLELGDAQRDEWGLLRWLIGTSAEVRRAGVQRVFPDVGALKKELSQRKKKGQVRWDTEGLVLHIPTTSRALRQYKGRGKLSVSYTYHCVYTQCPATGVELMFTKIHPDIDPGDSINPQEEQA